MSGISGGSTLKTRDAADAIDELLQLLRTKNVVNETDLSDTLKSKMNLRKVQRENRKAEGLTNET